MSHKIQLDRIPLVYHLKRDVDLVFGESLSHGKNLLYFAVEMVMTDEELKKKRFMELFHNKAELIKFLGERIPEIAKAGKRLWEAKENYQEWKEDSSKARRTYLAAFEMAGKLLTRVR